MKIIHCSDLHLDASLKTNHNSETARIRRAELLHTFHRMIDYAATHGVSIILLCGDIFDTEVVSRATRRFVENEIVQHPKIHFFYLHGNHDPQMSLFDDRSVPANLHIFDRTWRSKNVAVPQKDGSTFSVCVTGAEMSEHPETFFRSLRLHPERFNILMLHGQLAERAESTDHLTIPVALLRNKSIDYLALGHFHSFREGDLDARGKYAYCGSLEGHGFDECGEHGFVLLDIDEHRRTLQRTFVPFAARKYFDVVVDISLCPDTTHTINSVQKALDNSGATPQDLVRVTLTGTVDVTSEHNLVLLQREFEDEFFYFTISDASTPFVSYDDYLCDASLKGEFVRTIYALPDPTDCTREEIIRCGLRALAGEELFDL